MARFLQRLGRAAWEAGPALDGLPGKLRGSGALLEEGGQPSALGPQPRFQSTHA